MWKDETARDAFVDQCPRASHCHPWACRRVLESAFKREPCYLMATDNRQIQGVLPLD
jgi:hypothetical protein